MIRRLLESLGDSPDRLVIHGDGWVEEVRGEYRVNDEGEAEFVVDDVDRLEIDLQDKYGVPVGWVRFEFEAEPDVSRYDGRVNVAAETSGVVIEPCADSPALQFRVEAPDRLPVDKTDELRQERLRRGEAEKKVELLEAELEEHNNSRTSAGDDS